MTVKLPSVEHTRDSALLFFIDYTLKNKQSLQKKVVVDLSAGSGYIAHLFEEAGANVHLYDLLPQQSRFAKSPCKYVDLQKEFPIEEGMSDLVICAETIEHLPNQHHLFAEVSRILKPNGTFILTTPNSSSFRSRFSQFMMESEHYSTPAPNELNAVVFWDGKTGGYFGKLFISGVLRLRTLAALSGLSLKTIHPSKYSSTSIWMMIFYPFFYFFNKRVFRRQLKIDRENQSTYQTIFLINTSVKVLLSKHLIMEFIKK